MLLLLFFFISILLFALFFLVVVAVVVAAFRLQTPDALAKPPIASRLLAQIAQSNVHLPGRAIRADQKGLTKSKGST